MYDAVANGCIEPVQKPKAKGHFERLETVTHKYIYVDNEKPTGIDGAYVVSEAEATNGLGRNHEQVTLTEIGSNVPGYRKE